MESSLMVDAALLRRKCFSRLMHVSGWASLERAFARFSQRPSEIAGGRKG
ncbi:hypothetical protein L682_08685 [Aquipseudomonas alcaligenes OT 69]|nr:hypothetical protein L682_08685 [Pseudomonas alcaligenes OT 69]